MAYPIVRTDLMSGTTDPSQLRSLKYHNGTDYSDGINNGTVLKLDSIIDATVDREVWKGVKPAANDKIADIVLIATPELMYDSVKKNLDDFTNEADSVLRGYRFHSGDMFSITSDGVDGSAVAVGHTVELQAGLKLKAVASATSASTTVGKVVQVEQVGDKTYYVILVA